MFIIPKLSYNASMRYVDIYPATKTQNLKAEFFSYGWPFESEPQLGQLVFVPFGKRLIYGVISNIDAKPVAETKIKNVEKIVSDSPFI
ncbi:MAG TPA: hypothetical protein VEA37_13840, partial [Flavobacterium sp.]|nr:hypothetical protein [Flavobacterium sp.]